jgi:GNAT superfamily N-acetyltransferase
MGLSPAAAGVPERERPIGYVGAQDIGGAIELRRMYVQAAYRRQGVGTALVRALVTSCATRGAPAIELWTSPEGAGEQLYRTPGFRRVAAPGPEFADVRARTRYPAGADEVRMRLDLPRDQLAATASRA